MNNLKHIVQIFLSKLGQGIVLWIGFFAVAGIAVAAIAWPTSVPDIGESDGGSFATLLKKVLVNEDLMDLTNSGMVKDSDKVDGLHANELLAAGSTGDSSAPSVFLFQGDVPCATWLKKLHFPNGGTCYILNSKSLACLQHPSTYVHDPSGPWGTSTVGSTADFFSLGTAYWSPTSRDTTFCIWN